VAENGRPRLGGVVAELVGVVGFPQLRGKLGEQV
jgi:hypothetical protein